MEKAQKELWNQTLPPGTVPADFNEAVRLDIVQCAYKGTVEYGSYGDRSLVALSGTCSTREVYVLPSVFSVYMVIPDGLTPGMPRKEVLGNFRSRAKAKRAAEAMALEHEPLGEDLPIVDIRPKVVGSEVKV